MKKHTDNTPLVKPNSYWFPVILSLICGISLQSKAQGDLLLYPKRIVFDGSKKSQVLNIANTGRDTLRYLISVVQIRMKEDGSFETITQPDSSQLFADKNFRFFPRSVILGPNESQTVKMQLINMTALPAGEYRSHLYFRAEPEKKPLGEDEMPADSGSIAVRLTAIFGISIPVIIRVGETASSVNFSELSLINEKDSIPTMHMAVHRTGNISVYGDLSIDHISPKGKITRVAIAKGMAIYTPNTVRNFKLPLDRLAGVDYKKGSLHVAYTTPMDAKAIKMGEADMAL